MAFDKNGLTQRNSAFLENMQNDMIEYIYGMPFNCFQEREPMTPGGFFKVSS